LLTVGEPEPGRVILGGTPGLMGRLLAAKAAIRSWCSPTGSYKTSALVIPAVLEWSGPVVATSVKPDLLRATLAHRDRLGQVLMAIAADRRTVACVSCPSPSRDR
jgi:type IV secretory pathway TraG/TraD family ATPase VirD4